MQTMLRYWLLMAVIVTGFAGLIYAIVQQDIRHTADDPQIQMAEDIAAQLASGQQVQQVVPAEKVNIATSLAPYVIVFDATGTPLASSAQLNGQIPTLPSGVFASVRQGGEDRITWQPEVGVRSAVVVTQFRGAHTGFVLVGRSLREAEKREDDLLQITLVGWAAMLFATFLASAILLRKPSTSTGRVS